MIVDFAPDELVFVEGRGSSAVLVSPLGSCLWHLPSLPLLMERCSAGPEDDAVNWKAALKAMGAFGVCSLHCLRVTF